ncbi:uncharacterized protein LOC117649764 isoform X2 [Thrips palmi]|uniref:Uncharacterized protein LOC117649764 isoform X2 n=1 Tax=Thrips palmi TaxID=161013 RepID=A0A6P8ZU05_THRPL|nr:uncharacterized protein LOC117649764 isoform X2 [Thrips palmi]
MALTHGPDTGPCAVCKKPSARPCSRCRVDFYCGKEHQTLDWPRHRKGCGVLAVESNEALGRFVVATRAIPAGTILMREVPLVAYPVVLLPHAACTGCFARLPLGPLQGCQRCGFPVCGEACSLKEVHLPECSAFQRAGFKLSTKLYLEDDKYMNALKALRVHLATQKMPQGRRLAELKSDFQPRGQSGIPEVYAWELGQRVEETSARIAKAVSWLRGKVGMKWIPAKDLERALGAVDMNALQGSPCYNMDPDALQAVGLFAGHSLLEHSCAPNAFSYYWHNEDDSNRDDMETVLVAARDIARGEHVTITYLDGNSVCDAPTRRQTLLNWSFFCRCVLCRDPTELGLHLTAWYCGYCNRKGRRCLVEVPDICGFGCEGCGEGGYVRKDAEGNGWAEVSRLEARIKELRGSGQKVPRKVWKGLLSEALRTGGVLHPTHALVLQVKKELAFERALDKLAGRVPADASGQAGDLRQDVAYTRELLRVMDVLQPGISPARRDCLMNLYDLTEALLELPGNENNEALMKEYVELNEKIQPCLINPQEKKNFPALFAET